MCLPISVLPVPEMELRVHGHRRSTKETIMPATSEEAAVVREAVSMNILIVDDEPTIRDTCAEVARQSAMKPVTVATAEEALEVLEHTAIDILLTDLMLPQTSGLEEMR
jgi:PleD family two-component response regulator